jgi:orotidine-5'-phosphate decarboxylase
MHTPLISAPRSLIVSIDVPEMSEAFAVSDAVRGIPEVGGFKLGFELALNRTQAIGLTVDVIRKSFGTTTLIYDHQKAGNDIPDMGPKFARQVKAAGFDAAILFPFAGPETQKRWTASCQDVGLRVLVGGIMTHPQFLVGEGGYVADNAPERIFSLACEQGVTDFVVPGTKPFWIDKLKKLLDGNLGSGNFDLYAPGFITQGGDLNATTQLAGPRFHAIIGSAIYEPKSKEARRDVALRAVAALRG